MLPLWFRVNSGLFWRVLASSWGRRLGCRPQRRTRWGGAFVSTLWFRANSVAFRCSRCGFARFPASSGVFQPLLAGPLRLQAAAPVEVVSREFPCVSTLPLWFRTNSGLFWPLLGALVAGRNCCCGLARIPLHFEISTLPLWFRANSGLFSPLLGGAMRAAHAVGRGLAFVSTLPLWFRANSVAFRRSRCGFTRIPLRFDVSAVVSREVRLLLASGGRLGCGPQRRTRWCGAFVSTLPLWFRVNSCLFWRVLTFSGAPLLGCEFRCVSMLPLWFRADSVAFRCSRCGFARVPASSGVFWPLLGGPLRLLAATAHAVGRSTLPLWFRASFFACRRSRCGFARFPLRFDAPAVLGGRLGCAGRNGARGGAVDAPAVVSRKFRSVSTLSLWFRANSVAFRCSRCGFARLPLRFDASAVVSHEFPLRFDAPAVVSREFRGQYRF